MTNQDSFNWSQKATEIDNTPRFLKVGDVCIIVYGKYEEKTEKRKGANGEYESVSIIIPAKFRNGTIMGYVQVTKDMFSEIAQKFKEAGFPKEMPYVRVK